MRTSHACHYTVKISARISIPLLAKLEELVAYKDLLIQRNAETRAAGY
jgi:hypothetical protein